MLNYVPGPHQLPPARERLVGQMGKTNRNSKTPYDHVRQSGIGDLCQILASRSVVDASHTDLEQHCSGCELWMLFWRGRN